MMTPQFKKFVVGYLLLIALIIFSNESAAQITPCTKVTQVEGLKVMLDDIYFIAPSGTQPSGVSMQALAWKVSCQIRALKTELGASKERFELVPCLGRKPGSESDFTRDQVGQLNAQRVVLEVWGLLQNSAGATPESSPQALVGFAIIPLRFYEHFETNSGDMPGVYMAEFPFDITKPETLLERSADFKTYFTIGIGLKFFKEKIYNSALKSFCQAQHSLQPGGNKPTDPDKIALLDYVRKMTKTVVADARKGPVSEYNKVIRALDPNVAASCGQ
ncbi:hypothetical protein L0244_23640 [bacterium]|nr:hypothetical protein [bacterium]